jgi:hypothetical protein
MPSNTIHSNDWRGRASVAVRVIARAVPDSLVVTSVDSSETRAPV